MEFDAQREFALMRGEMRENHTELVKAIGKCVDAMAEHAIDDITKFADVDRRLSLVESTRKTLRWSIGCIFVATLTLVGDMLVHLLTKVHP